MLLMIDNYDSFTYNLVQYLGELYGPNIRVCRNDAVTIDEIRAMPLRGIVISPGPCTPREAGISVEAIRVFGASVPILGVCLGHQSIGFAFGGNVIRAPYLMHGKTSEIHHHGAGVYEGLPNPFTATRYHSLIVERSSLPDSLEVTSETSDGLIMGLRHRQYRIEGVQFHPESILTGDGKKLLDNWIQGIVK